MTATSRHNGGMRSISAAFRMTGPTDAQAMELDRDHAPRTALGRLAPDSGLTTASPPRRLAQPGPHGPPYGPGGGCAQGWLDRGLDGCFQRGTGSVTGGVSHPAP